MTATSDAVRTSQSWPIVSNGPAAGVTWRRLVGVGDSVIAGIGDPVDGYPDISWFDQLAGLLGPDASVTNLGIVGLRSAAIVDGQLDRALALQPDLVVLSAGGNDMFAADFDPEAVAADLDRLVGTLCDAGADVVTFGFFGIAHLLAVPPALRGRLAGRNRQLAGITGEAARRHGAIHIDNSHREAPADVMSADGIHFNRRGHALLAKILAEVLHLEP